MSNLDFYIDRPETDQLLNGLKQAFQSPANSPLIFHAYGIGGIGKTALTTKIRQDFPDAVVVRIDTGIEIKTETPLEVMDKIYHQLPALSDGRREDFPDKYRQYQETRRLIEQDTQGKDLIKVTQSVAQATLPKAVGEIVKHGSQAIIDSPRLIESFDKFLANFPKTKGKTEDKEALRNLMLDPYGTLTKLLVTALLTRANQQPLILIFDTYEQVGKDVDDWLLQYLLREHQLQDKLIRLVITGQQRLSSRSDYRGGWQKLEQDRGCIFEVQIPRFNEKQTTEYLQRSGIQGYTEIQRIYSITKGWPYYLKEVAKQSDRLDFSQIEEDLSEFLLRTASPEQRELVKIASCCRGFNTGILDELWQALGKDPISAELHEWLKRLSFISKKSGTWRFDDVSRDIFRKTLFDDNPTLFEQVNRSLFTYFGQQSDSYVASDAPIVRKYQNEDWLKERSSFLYHSLFVRQPNFLQFVTHLLEAYHFRRGSLIAEVVQLVNAEAPVEIHHNLSNSCRIFLAEIIPVAFFGKFFLENPKLCTNQQDQAAINRIWQYDEQLTGLARFVMLYCQASHETIHEARRSLLQLARQQAEVIKIDRESEFSSGLFFSNLANKFYEIDCYEEAIESYDQAISFKPNLHEAWSNRGSALNDLGRYEEAIESCDRAISFKPDLYEAWYNRGNSLNDLGRYEEAIISYEKAVAIKPSSHEVWYNRGLSLGNLCRYQEAVTSYEKAVAIEPNDHEAWNNLGFSLCNLGRYEEAIIFYKKATTIKPDKHEAFYNWGISLDHLGRYEEAISLHNQAVTIKPDYHEAWYNIGVSLGNLRRYEDAITSYKKAVAIKPDYHEAWNNLGFSMDNLGRYEEARTSYKRALAIKSDDYEAWYNLGVSSSNLGKYEEAIASYERAIDIKLDSYEAWNNLGFSMDNLGRYEEAVAAYERAVDIKPDSHEAWNNQGVSLRKLGRHEEAIAPYAKAVAIKPDLYEAWNNQAFSLVNLGRYEEAIASYDRTLAIKPDLYKAWSNRGSSLANLGRYEEALESYNRAVAIKPDFHEVWNNRGVCLDNLGRYKEALESYSRAMVINPI